MLFQDTGYMVTYLLDSSIILALTRIKFIFVCLSTLIIYLFIIERENIIELKIFKNFLRLQFTFLI